MPSFNAHTARRPDRRESLVTGTWALATALVTWWLSFHPMRNADLWWHLAAGRWIVRHGRVPRTDPFSFSMPDGRWLNHEWLADVVFFLWSRPGGVEWLVLWYWGVLVATALALFFLCRRLGAADWAAFSGAAVAIASARPFLEIRPHLYSLLLTVALLGAVLVRRHLPLWLPVLFAVWVNLHASFIFGLGVATLAVGLDFVGAAVGHRRAGESARAALEGRGRELLVLLASGLATLVNPYGFHVYSFPLRYAFDRESPFRTLKEWLPPFAAEGVSSPVFPWMIALAALGAMVAIARWRRSEAPWAWPALLIAATTLAMALQSGRFIPLFAVAAAVVGAPVFRRGKRSRGRGSAEAGHRLRFLGKVAFPLVIIAAAAVGLSRYPLGPRVFPQLVSLESFPIGTANFLAANELSGRVFNYFGWGGYLQYRLGEQVSVFIDSRADTVYSDEVYERYRRVQYMLPGWEDVVERSGAEYFLWLALETPQVQRIEQADRLVATGRWRKLHEDFASVLLVRQGVEVPSSLAVSHSYVRELALGARHMRLGDKAAAERHLREALRLNPRSLAACRNLALTLAWSDRPNEALAQRDRCNEIFPEPEADMAVARLIEERARRR